MNYRNYQYLISEMLLKWLLGGGCPNPEHGVRGADASEQRARGRALNFFFDRSSAGQDTTGFDKDVCVVWSPRGVAQKSHTQLVGQERVSVHFEIAGGGSANAKVQNFKIGIHTLQIQGEPFGFSFAISLGFSFGFSVGF